MLAKHIFILKLRLRVAITIFQNIVYNLLQCSIFTFHLNQKPAKVYPNLPLQAVWWKLRGGVVRFLLGEARKGRIQVDATNNFQHVVEFDVTVRLDDGDLAVAAGSFLYNFY